MNYQLAVFSVSILLYLIISFILLKGRISLKYALVWFVPSTVIFLLAIIPDVFYQLGKMLGFQTLSSLIVGILLVLLIFICISLTIIVSGQKVKITLLIQEVSMLKEKIN